MTVRGDGNQKYTVPPIGSTEANLLRHSHRSRLLDVRLPQIHIRRTIDLDLRILKGLVVLRGLYKNLRSNECAQLPSIAENTKFGYPTSLHVTLETVFLQLNFPALLRESARAATPCTKAVATCAPTNAIAIANIAATTNLSKGVS